MKVAGCGLRFLSLHPSIQTIKHQEISQMGDAIIIIASDPRSHRNYILGIIVFDITQIPEFPFPGFAIRYHIGNLNVDSSGAGFLTQLATRNPVAFSILR